MDITFDIFRHSLFACNNSTILLIMLHDKSLANTRSFNNSFIIFFWHLHDAHLFPSPPPKKNTTIQIVFLYTFSLTSPSHYTFLLGTSTLWTRFREKKTSTQVRTNKFFITTYDLSAIHEGRDKKYLNLSKLRRL